MPKYHISTSGKPAICKAEKKPCPLGGQHFDSRAEASTYAAAHAPSAAGAAFPRRGDDNFMFRQARIYWVDEDSRGIGRHSVYRNASALNADDIERRLFEDYSAGFEAGIGHGEQADREAVFAQETGANPSVDGLLERSAWNRGYERGIRIREASPEDFLRRPMGDSRFPSHGDNERYKKLRFAYNPFGQGDEIIVPAGTVFDTTDPKYRKNPERSAWGRGVKKRAAKYKVYSAYQGSVDGSVGRRTMRPGQVSVVGSGGYWQDINITPELLAANGKPLYDYPADKWGMISESPTGL